MHADLPIVVIEPGLKIVREVPPDRVDVMAAVHRREQPGSTRPKAPPPPRRADYEATDQHTGQPDCCKDRRDTEPEVAGGRRHPWKRDDERRRRRQQRRTGSQVV